MVISAQDPLCLANPLPAPLQTAGVWPCSQGKLWQRAHSGAPSPVAVWHRKCALSAGVEFGFTLHHFPVMWSGARCFASPGLSDLICVMGMMPFPLLN